MDTLLEFVRDDSGRVSKILVNRDMVALLGGRSVFGAQLPLVQSRYRRWGDLPNGIRTILSDAGIKNPYDLSKFTKEEIMDLRGIAKKKISMLDSVLIFHQLKWRGDE